MTRQEKGSYQSYWRCPEAACGNDEPYDVFQRVCPDCGARLTTASLRYIYETREMRFLWLFRRTVRTIVGREWRVKE